MAAWIDLSAFVSFRDYLRGVCVVRLFGAIDHVRCEGRSGTTQQVSMHKNGMRWDLSQVRSL